MKWTTMILTFLLLGAGDRPIAATAGEPQELYRQAVDREIAQCDRKALFTGSRGKNLQAYGQKALDQAVYYRNQTDNLVHQMASLNIEPKAYKLHYFLICSYCNPKKPQLALNLNESAGNAGRD